MLTKKRYGLKDLAKWTRFETLAFAILSTTVTILYELFEFTFLSFPWTPIAVVGTAVAFMIGFSEQCSLWQNLGSAKDLGRNCEHITYLGNEGKGYGLKRTCAGETIG